MVTIPYFFPFSKFKVACLKMQMDVIPVGWAIVSISVCACGSWVCSSKMCQQHEHQQPDRLNEIDQLLDKDEEDEIMNDDEEEDEDDEDLSEVNKIFKIEEDDAMIDPDEDEFIPRYTNLDDYDEDEALDDDQAMMDYLYDYDEKAEKRKKSKSKKSHH